MYQAPLKLYPFKSNWLDIAGQRMHFLDEGPAQAPIILMLHGNPTWSFYYRKLVLALRDRYRCIVPDHIGCGLSDKPADKDYSYTLAQRISDLDALVSHISPTSAIHLVLHDWGGMIGLGWASKQPDTVSSMVITNTAAFPLPPEKKLPIALKLARSPVLGPLLVRGLNAFSGIAARVAFRKPVSKAVREGYTGPYDSWRNRIATLRFVQDIPLAPGDPAYAIVKTTEECLPDFADKPCLLAWGEQDFVFDLHFLQRWQALFPDAEVHRYTDCGHYLLEDAGQGLVNVICKFFEAHA